MKIFSFLIRLVAMIKKYVDDPSLTWEERYKRLEEHHIEETTALVRRPRLGVIVLIKDNDGNLILGKRGKEPNYGKWVVPGGRIEYCESFTRAAKREILEETGLHIAMPVDTAPEVWEIIHPNEHRVILCARGNIVGGIMQAGSDLLEVKSFSKEEIKTLDISNPVRRMLEFMKEI